MSAQQAESAGPLDSESLGAHVEFGRMSGGPSDSQSSQVPIEFLSHAELQVQLKEQQEHAVFTIDRGDFFFIVTVRL